MQTVVNFVDKVLMNIDDEKVISSVKNDVKEFMKQFVLYPEFG
jgi:glycine hydroxymethyltransferase